MDVALSDEGTNTRGRRVAFALTWTSYAAYYLGRKGLSVAKSRIGTELGAGALKGVETAYLAAYAIGLYVSGAVGDAVGSRRLIGFGMLASAGACAAFGASSVAWMFLVAFLVNGFAQSTGWPGNIKAMAEWTTPKTRGSVMGVWATCYQVGGIMATAVAARLLRFGWRAAFFGPAIAIALVGVLVLAFLRSPERIGSTSASQELADAQVETALRAEDRARVFRSVRVWSYGASYFCIKLIRYSLLFWLPYYLTKELGYSEERAGYLSTSFEIGGVFGTVALGVLSDRARALPRPIWSAISLVLLAGSLFVYARVGASSAAMNFAAMALVGALLFGPDALLSGAAAQDAGGPRAAALAAGLVNGVGSLGAMLQEAVTRGVTSRWGWSALFNVLLGLALLAALALTPTFRREPKSFE
jgi:sugar phosphate permease